MWQPKAHLLTIISPGIELHFTRTRAQSTVLGRNNQLLVHVLVIVIPLCPRMVRP